MYTRREFSRMAIGAMVLSRPIAAAAGSKVEGVRLGVQTYSFRALPRPEGGDLVEAIVRAMAECGLDECELFAPHLEPRGRSREELRAWRLETPLDHFRGVERKFKAAGLAIHAYNYSFDASFSDDEIDRGFMIARALGAAFITASTTIPVARRVVPFAEKHQMVVAMHGHSNVADPNEFATPESFAVALALSKYFKVNLDIGHFTAANFDAVTYIREHHADITNLHIKDRKKDQGDNTPWGEGDTPIREVLQLLKTEGWPIPAYIEYEYGGTSPVEEVRRCYDYAKKALGQVTP